MLYTGNQYIVCQLQLKSEMYKKILNEKNF